MRRILVFSAIGGVAAVVNVLARIAFNQLTNYETAIVLAFPVALTTAFMLNKQFVFHNASGAVHGQYLRFTLVNLVALAQVWLVSVALARWFFPALDFDWHADTLAHAIGVASPIFSSYFAHKHFSFRG